MPAQMSTAPKKFVAFGAKVKVTESLHISEYTDEEVLACYYSRANLCEFRDDAKKTAGLMESKQRLNLTQTCQRGAEGLMPAALKKRKRDRKISQLTVLKEQLIQDEEGWSSERKIAQVYMETTRESVEAARLMGLEDAKTAELIKLGLDASEQKGFALTNVILKLGDASFRSLASGLPGYTTVAPSAA